MHFYVVVVVVADNVFSSHPFVLWVGLGGDSSFASMCRGGPPQELVDGGAVGRRLGGREEGIFDELVREGLVVVECRSYLRQTLHLRQLEGKIVD